MIHSNAAEGFQTQTNQKSCLLAKSWNKLTCLFYCIDFTACKHRVTPTSFLLRWNLFSFCFAENWLFYTWGLALWYLNLKRGPAGGNMAIPIRVGTWSGSTDLPRPCWLLFPLVLFPLKKQTLGESSSITIFKIPPLVSSIQEKFMPLPALGDLLQIL